MSFDCLTESQEMVPFNTVYTPSALSFVQLTWTGLLRKYFDGGVPLRVSIGYP